MSIILKAENISKQYRLGTVGTGTLRHDLNRWWHMVRGKEDPYLKVGTVNDRSAKASEEYVWALQDINFEVKQGEVLGIIGKNGAGKSTLLKILSRVTAPTTGIIKTRGRIASLLEVGTGFHPELTGRENIYLNGAILGMTKPEIKSKIDEIIDFSGCEMYIDTPVKRYSSGMRVRLGFAVAAHLEPEILVVDEVLAVGDAEFQKKAIGKMQDLSMGEGRTVLFVSHNMASVQNLCTRAIILKEGNLEKSGNPTDVINEYLKEESQVYKDNPTTKKIKNGIKGPTITHCLLTNIQQELQNVFLPHEVIGVTLNLDNHLKEDRKYSVVCFIKNMLDENVAVCSSGKMNDVWYQNKDTDTIRFEIDPIGLVPGSYYLRFVLHVPGDDNFDEWEKAIFFKIEEHDYLETGYNYGDHWNPKMFLKTKWF